MEMIIIKILYNKIYSYILMNNSNYLFIDCELCFSYFRILNQECIFSGPSDEIMSVDEPRRILKVGYHPTY